MVRWARFLSRPGGYCDRLSGDGVTLNDAALLAYVGFEGVPPSLVEACISPSTDAEARELERVSSPVIPSRTLRQMHSRPRPNKYCVYVQI